jgi:hypothetical protein
MNPNQLIGIGDICRKSAVDKGIPKWPLSLAAFNRFGRRPFISRVRQRAGIIDASDLHVRRNNDVIAVSHGRNLPNKGSSLSKAST